MIKKNLLVGFIAIVAAIIYSGQSHYFIQKLNELLHWKSGCNPIADVGNVSLHYFAARGRAEMIRLLMEDQKISYTETKFTKETWQDFKQAGIDDGLYIFGQVPAIVTSQNKRLVQSKVILQYLGRSTGLDCDCRDLERADILAASAEDLYQKKSRILWNPEFTHDMRDDYIKNTLAIWWAHFERVTPRGTGEADGIYFVSDRLTWVDYVIFDMIETNCGLIEHTARAKDDTNYVATCDTFLQSFPRLKNFYKTFSTRPNIEAYRNSSTRFPFKIPYEPK